MKILRHLALTIALLAPLASAPAALAANHLPGVGTVSVGAGGATVTLAVPGKAGAPYRVMWLSSPYRLVVDLQGHWLGAPSSSIYIGAGLVTQIRAARHASGLTRIVFDLTAPADMRTDNVGGTLVLNVVPRGAATGAVPVPAPYGAVPAPRAVVPVPGYVAPGVVAPGYPAPVPTRRPVPAYPGYPAPGYAVPGYAVPPGYPIARVTPIPVMPTMGWQTPPPAYPQTPQYTAPMPMQTPPPQPMYTPPPMAMQTPPPATVVPPPFSPEPLPSMDLPPPELPMGPRPVFGNRFLAGGGVALSVSEDFAAGKSQSSVAMVPQGDIVWDQMFTNNFGIAAAARLQSYTIQDDEAKTAGIELKHRRDEAEGNVGIRARFDLPAGLEVLAQPQFAFRNVGVKTTQATIAADGTVGTASDVTGLNDYLSTGWLGYGGGLGAGLGWRATDWLGLTLGGEFNYLLGSATNGVPLPMTNIRAGADLRLEFGNFGTAIGYKYASYSATGFSQSWNGPVIQLGIVY